MLPGKETVTQNGGENTEAKTEVTPLSSGRQKATEGKKKTCFSARAPPRPVSGLLNISTPDFILKRRPDLRWDSCSAF